MPVDLTASDLDLIEDVALLGIKATAEKRNRAISTIKNRMHKIHQKTETRRLAELVWIAFVEPTRVEE